MSIPSSPTTPSLSIAMLSTWPPTRCGLATFAAALTRALVAQGHRVAIVPVDADDSDPSRVTLRAGSPESAHAAAARLSRADLAIVQHEYGIYGGADGQEVLTVMDAMEAPVMVVLHTVLASPSTNERRILERLCARADVVVVMSASARERLLCGYHVDSAKVITIPHGARLPATTRASSTSPPSFLSWGLVGPGKGLEHAIQAVGLLDQLGVPVRYTVAGTTHPKVLARYGPAYRDGLVALARQLRVDHLVSFDERYRDVEELTEFITQFDTVVLPYDTTEQVTSGVLIDSLAAGRAIISTRFPHATELLGDGAGLLVPHRDARALAVAMHTIVSEPGALASMQATARRMAADFSWDAVGLRYAEVARAAISTGVRP